MIVVLGGFGFIDLCSVGDWLVDTSGVVSVLRT